MNRIAAIHQPNFFPWLGYFHKIARSDIFVFLDNVQFPKTGGAWTNRVKMLVSGEAKWLTASIDRDFHGARKINQMIFFHGHPWRRKIAKTLQSEYSRHPYYAETMEILWPLLMNAECNIAEYNINAVTALSFALGLDTSKVRRSSAYLTAGAGTELLCSLTKAVGADTYLCGGGAEGYQDDMVFAANSLNLQYQNFRHPVYPQHKETGFTPGLSIVDALMNLGFKALGDLLRLNEY